MALDEELIQRQIVAANSKLDECLVMLRELMARTHARNLPPRPEDMLDVYEAAAYVKCNPQLLRDAAVNIRRPLMHVRVGRRFRFKRKWLDTWMGGRR